MRVKARQNSGKGADCKEKVKQKKSAGKEENCKICVKRQRSFGKEDFYENEVKRQEKSGKAELCEDGVKRQQEVGKVAADGIRWKAAANAIEEEAGDNPRTPDRQPASECEQATRERMRAGSARRENDNRNARRQHDGRE